MKARISSSKSVPEPTLTLILSNTLPGNELRHGQLIGDGVNGGVRGTGGAGGVDGSGGADGP